MTEEQLRFDVPDDDPVTAYLASGLTALNHDQMTIVELVSGFISECCSDSKVRVHQPVLYTNPHDQPDLDPARVHAIDFESVAKSDVVIAIGDFPSWGAGKELVWAERLRIPVLLLCRDVQLMSRLVTGSTGDITVKSWRTHSDLREVWKSYFVERKADLESHQRMRARRRELWEPTRQLLRTAYDELAEADQRTVAATTRLREERLEEMLRTSEALAGASVDELQAFANALGLPSSAAVNLTSDPPLLSTQDLEALSIASELEEWDGQHAIRLVQRAKVELAKGGTRRLRFREANDWIEFDRG